MSAKISVRDVAAAAGVSIATVSRVLNATGYASASVRARVNEAVQQTGYQPDFSARHLRTGRSRAVGFIVSNMGNPLLASLYSAVEMQMQVAGFNLLVTSSYQQPAKEAELLTLFENRRLEGVFALPAARDEPAGRSPFADCPLPLVLFDRDHDCDGDRVLLDHRDGVARAVQYLASLGHRRIALLGPSLSIRPGRDKLLGYRQGLALAGIAEDAGLVHMLHSAVDSCEAEMEEMMFSPDPPTAIIALGTRILSGALKAVRRHGRRIPDDLSVIGIGTEDSFALSAPPLTSLRFNIMAAAAAAANLMLDRINNNYAGPPRQVTLPLDLVLGQSCRPNPTMQ